MGIIFSPSTLIFKGVKRSKNAMEFSSSEPFRNCNFWAGPLAPVPGWVMWWHPQGLAEGGVCSLCWMDPALGQLMPWGCRGRGTWPSSSQVLKQARPTDLGFLYMRPQWLTSFVMRPRELNGLLILPLFHCNSLTLYFI